MLLVPFDFQAAYDALNPDAADHRFYAALASRLSAERAVDLGCGTGTLAVLLARGRREVIGIDPDPEMLRVARQRAGNELVTWQQGYAEAMPSAWADLVTMSGHVSQVQDARRQGWNLMFQDRHPFAGGPDHYAAYPLSSRLDLSESSPIGDPVEIPLGASTSGCGCGAGRALTSDAGARHRRVGGEQLPVPGPAEQCLGVGSRR